MITHLRNNRGLALLLIATMATGGCVSVRARSAEPVAGQGSLGRVEVNIYDTASARKSGVRTIIHISVWSNSAGGTVH